MLKFYFNKRIIVAFIITLAIVSWLEVASFLNKRKVINAENMVAHTLEVFFNTERLLAIVTNLELGRRDYGATFHFTIPNENGS
jgi:CHASE3 domain sensor protein